MTKKQAESIVRAFVKARQSAMLRIIFDREQRHLTTSERMDKAVNAAIKELNEQYDLLPHDIAKALDITHKFDLTDLR